MNIDLPPTQTERISLFILKPVHVDERYLSWLSDPYVNRYLESRFTSHSLESTRQFVNDCLDRNDTILLGINDKALGGKHVGNIKLGPIDKNHGLGEIGLLIGEKQAWGQGIGTDAIELVIALARDVLGLRKLTAGCYGSNIGSKKAFMKAGFVVEAQRERHYLLDGNSETLVLMARWV